jgi:hypothetical protein
MASFADMPLEFAPGSQFNIATGLRGLDAIIAVSGQPYASTWRAISFSRWV